VVAEDYVYSKGRISGGDKLMSFFDIMNIVDGVSASLLKERYDYAHGLLQFKDVCEDIDLCGKMATEGRIASADNLKSLMCLTRGLQDIRPHLQS